MGGSQGSAGSTPYWTAVLPQFPRDTPESHAHSPFLNVPSLAEMGTCHHLPQNLQSVLSTSIPGPDPYRAPRPPEGAGIPSPQAYLCLWGGKGGGMFYNLHCFPPSGAHTPLPHCKPSPGSTVLPPAPRKRFFPEEWRGKGRQGASDE